MDVFANDQFFQLVVMVVVPFIVALAERIPGSFTSDRKPFVAAIVGGGLGGVYHIDSIYSALHGIPPPADATLASFIVGGVIAGWAGVGVRAAAKNAMPTKISGTGVGVLLLVATLAGGAMLATSACVTNPAGTPIVVGTSMTQNDARRALTALQDTRAAALKAMAAVYVARPGDAAVAAAAVLVDNYDRDFARFWRAAADACDAWNVEAFLAWYIPAKQRADAMTAASAEVR